MFWYTISGFVFSALLYSLAYPSGVLGIFNVDHNEIHTLPTMVECVFLKERLLC